MNRNPPFRALVVDDDAVARKMVIFSLAQEGFACDTAHDGLQAAKRLSAVAYDLVVMDLRMPNRNGHSLVVDLLEDADRPVLVVHTSVDEPRMMKDLMARGVDDVVYKPANYPAFAAKAKALIERDRRSRREPVGTSAGEGVLTEATPQDAITLNSESSRGQAEFPDVCHLSHIASEVHRLAMERCTDFAEIAKAIRQDDSLTSKFLREGNRAYCLRTGKPATDLEQLLVWLGSRHISELVLQELSG